MCSTHCWLGSHVPHTLLAGWLDSHVPDTLLMKIQQPFCSTPPDATQWYGKRRSKTPTMDMEHLLDILKRYVRKSGLEGSLNFGEYFNITRPMAVNGKELAEQLEFLRGLAQVNPELVFKRSELKDIYKELEKTFPDLKHKFNLEKRACGTACHFWRCGHD